MVTRVHAIAGASEDLPVGSRLASGLRVFARVAGASVALVGVLMLCAWALDNPAPIRRPAPSSAPVRARVVETGSQMIVVAPRRRRRQS